MTENLADFSWYTGNLEWLRERTIFLTKHGSHAYGTNLPTSDLDLKGIAISPRAYYLGFLHNFEQAEAKATFNDGNPTPDVVVYDIRKFFKLASACNPNIIEMLYTDQEDWVRPEPRMGLQERWSNQNPWPRIVGYRDLFLSRQAQHTFSGYAFAQLKRIKSHRAWLLDPPKRQPERSDFGLRDGEGTLGKEQLGAIEAKIRKLTDKFGGDGFSKDKVEALEEGIVGASLESLDIDTNLIPLILAERRYAGAMRNWAAYQTWKAERNPARAELEAKYGYDTKHAMHLVRLLNMATEILGSGKVIVKRPDAALLLDVRNGRWSYDELLAYAEKTEKHLAVLAKDSPLPKEPDRAALDRLLVEVVAAYP